MRNARSTAGQTLTELTEQAETKQTMTQGFNYSPTPFLNRDGTI
jgi:hypothetical protein